MLITLAKSAKAFACFIFVTVLTCVQGQSMPPQWIHSPLTEPQMMAVSSDGRHVVVGGNGPIQVYSVANGTERTLPTLDLPSYAAIALSPDGHTLAVAGKGTSEDIELIEFWNIETGTLLSSVETTYDLYIYCLAFSPDGKLLAVGGTDGSNNGYLNLLDMASKIFVQTINASGLAVGEVCFSHDGSMLADAYATFSELGSEVWSLKTGEQIFEHDDGLGYGYSAIALSPDGRKLAIASNKLSGPVMNTWSLGTGKLDQSFSTAIGTGSHAGILSVSYSANGEFLADCGYGNGTLLETWSPSTGHKLMSSDKLGESELYCVSFSPDGATIVDLVNGVTNLSGTNLSRIEFLDVKSLALEKSFLTGALKITSALVYSPSGQYLAASAIETDESGSKPVVTLWNPLNGKLMASFSTSANNQLNSMTFSPDGKTLVVGGSSTKSGGILELWDVESQTRLQSLQPAASGSVTSVVVLPGGKDFMVAGQVQGGAAVYETWSFAGPHTLGSNILRTSGEISSIAVSPDAKTLVVGYNDSTWGGVQTWDLVSRTTTAWLPTGSTKGVYSVAYCSNGKTFATSGLGQVYEGNETGYIPFAYMEVWDSATGNLATSVSRTDFGSNRQPVTYTPDGRDLIFGIYDSINAISTLDWSVVWGEPIGVSVAIAVSPGSNQICSSFPNGTILAVQSPVYHVPVLASFKLSAPSVLYGNSVVGTLSLYGPAPAGGCTVSLSSEFNDLTMPAQIVVPAGETTATILISANIWSGQNSETITAISQDGGQVSTSLTIVLPQVLSIGLSPSTVSGGHWTIATVTLNQPAPSGGVPVTLATTSPLAFGQANLIVPAGSRSVKVRISTPAVSSTTTAAVVATVAGVSKTAILTIN